MPHAGPAREPPASCLAGARRCGGRGVPTLPTAILADTRRRAKRPRSVAVSRRHARPCAPAASGASPRRLVLTGGGGNAGARETLRELASATLRDRNGWGRRLPGLRGQTAPRAAEQ